MFVVKTTHSRSPKKFVDEQIKDMTSGTWIVLVETIDGERPFTVGYQDNTETVLVCKCSRGADATEARVTFEASFLIWMPMYVIIMSLVLELSDLFQIF